MDHINTKKIKIDPLNISDELINYAAKFLLSGEIVAFPTETVYGLGASAISDEAVSKIYEIKKRPFHNPLIIHVASLEQAKNYGIFNYHSENLAQKFWPGPLTLLVNKSIGSRISTITGQDQ